MDIIDLVFYSSAVIERDKPLEGKLVYISNDEKQNYPDIIG